MVKLHLLGRAELGGDDTGTAVPMRFLPERRFRLLAYLALRGEWVSRDELATLFWPDRAQGAARSNLRKLLQEARALDLPELETDRNSVRWSVSTDVAEFNAALKRGDTDVAIALYRGPALHGLEGGESEAFSTWLAGERWRLHAAWREAAVALLPRREPAGALALAQRLLVDDPFDEDAMVAALDAHGELGDSRGAAEAFRSYAERLIEELGVEPSARVRSAAARMTKPSTRQAGPAPPKASKAPTAASPPLTALSFIGRDRELQELKALLANPDCRLLTVTGPGGVGKSRLVKQLVRELATTYADGVTWIALGDLADVAQVAPRIAVELALAIDPTQDPIARIAEHVASRQMLLVLDNSEHLPRLSALLDLLITAAPRLQVVSTSRSRIGIRDEWLLPLSGLALPPPDGTPHDNAAAPAVQMFVAHARAADPRFDVEANTPHIARVVRAVGGLPLAILLAASWVRLLPVTDMVSDVTHLLDVLEQAEEGEERPEHRSVRATFEQSWRLLSPAEQRVLTVLSVFAGTFTRAAVHDVSQAPLPVLGSLIDKSLVQIDRDARCSLHPLIQQFAAHKLAQDPARREAARGQHAAFYARMMGQYGHFNSIDQAAALRTIAIELPNILAAWEWAIAKRLADTLDECSSGLSNYFQARGPIKAGLELFARAEAAIDGTRQVASDAAWSLALEHAALHYWLGNYQEVEAAGRRALAAGRARKSGFAVRSSLNTVGLALYRQGHLAEAERYLSQAVMRAKAEHIPGDAAAFAGNLVAVKRELGDDEGALRLARDTLNGHRTNGHRIGEISMTIEIGLILHGMGELAAAIDSYEQGLRLANEADMPLRRIYLLSHLAAACLDMGDFERAQQTGRDALQLALKCGVLAHEPTCRRTLAAIDLATGDLASARTQLCAAIVAARRIGSALVIGPLLRDCAAYLERAADAATALRCVACADGHLISKARPLARYRDLRERLRASLSAEAAEAAEAQGAALSPQAGLDLAEGALGNA